jgi:hypothetical protein
MPQWLRSLFRRRPVPQWRLSLRNDAVRLENREGPQETLAFADLAAVVIETNESGPWGDDVIWHLLGRAEGSALSIPQTAEDFPMLLTRLEALPGFDNREVVAGMGSTTLNAFLCWEADKNVRPDSVILSFARARRGDVTGV